MSEEDASDGAPSDDDGTFDASLYAGGPGRLAEAASRNDESNEYFSSSSDDNEESKEEEDEDPLLDDLDDGSTPSVRDMMKALANHPTYLCMREKKKSRVENILKDSLVNENRMPWEKFRQDLLDSIQENRATKVSQIDARKANHQKNKSRLYKELASCNPHEFDPNTRELTEWTSMAYRLAYLFVQIFEHRLVYGDTDIYTKVPELLKTDSQIDVDFDQWEKEKVYFVAGWLSFAVNKKASRRLKKVAEAIKVFSKNTNISRTDAVGYGERLPIRETVSTELYDGLRYVSFAFYIFVLRIEKVYQYFLTGRSISIYGPRVIAYLNDALIKELLEEFSDKFLKVESNESEIQEADAKATMEILLSTYGNMRLKDYVKKVNGRLKTASLKKSHRGNIASISMAAKEKAKKKKRDESHEQTLSSLEGQVLGEAERSVEEALEGRKWA